MATFFGQNTLRFVKIFLVLGFLMGFARISNRALESEKIIIGFLKSEKIGSLESEKSGPYRSIPGT